MIRLGSANTASIRSHYQLSWQSINSWLWVSNVAKKPIQSPSCIFNSFAGKQQNIREWRIIINPVVRDTHPRRSGDSIDLCYFHNNFCDAFWWWLLKKKKNPPVKNRPMCVSLNLYKFCLILCCSSRKFQRCHRKPPVCLSLPHTLLHLCSLISLLITLCEAERSVASETR